MIKFIKVLIIDEEAQGITEYILLVTLISLSLIWIDSGFSTAIEAFYEDIGSGVTPLGADLVGDYPVMPQWP